MKNKNLKDKFIFTLNKTPYYKVTVVGLNENVTQEQLEIITDKLSEKLLEIFTPTQDDKQEIIH